MWNKSSGVSSKTAWYCAVPTQCVGEPALPSALCDDVHGRAVSSRATPRAARVVADPEGERRPPPRSMEVVDGGIAPVATLWVTESCLRGYSNNRHKTVLLFVLLFLSSQFSANAQSVKAPSLIGLAELNVVIEDLDDNAKVGGLTVSQLQTDVELRLRQAGLRVNTTALEFLHVRVTALGPTAAGEVAWKVDVELQQPVIIVRTKEATTGTTWDASSIALSSSPSFIPSNVRGKVRDFVDAFLDDWLSMNAKR